MKRSLCAVPAAILLLALLSLGMAQNVSQRSFEAVLYDAETLEQNLGTITFTSRQDGGLIGVFDVESNDVISAGEHAIHIHENGTCQPADSDGDGTEDPAGAAGGHFNPGNVGHGEDNGPHVGDSAEYNYTFEDDGSFTGQVTFPLATVASTHAVLGNAGTALVIHEGTDDMESDPSGNSGPRIACAVIRIGVDGGS